MGKKDCIKSQGLVTEVLGYENYRVELDNGVSVLCTVSGKMRMNHVRVMAGDRVDVEMSPYDLTRGRISFRHKVRT